MDKMPVRDMMIIKVPREHKHAFGIFNFICELEDAHGIECEFGVPELTDRRDLVDELIEVVEELQKRFLEVTTEVLDLDDDVLMVNVNKAKKAIRGDL
mgnify:CR=1 FL=1